MSASKSRSGIKIIGEQKRKREEPKKILDNKQKLYIRHIKQSDIYKNFIKYDRHL